jgi:hypothetical protein
VNTTTIPKDILELLPLADMYANICTRQEEKFIEYRRQGKVSYSWEDCIAAYDLLKDLSGYWEFFALWKTTEHFRTHRSSVRKVY